MTDDRMLREELDARIADYRKQMNDEGNEPALRYMAAGAFEAMRDWRGHWIEARRG